MLTEFEAKFLNIDKAALRKKLADKGAVLLRAEFLQKRINFDLPGDLHSVDKWIRVRDEGDKITLALKMMLGDKIEDQKEIGFAIEDFDKAVALLETIGCRRRNLQESMRELWRWNSVEFMLDTWPALPPYIEIEAPTEKEVRDATALLEFDYSKAVFGSAGKVYLMYYGFPYEKLEEQYGLLTFDNEKLKSVVPPLKP